MNIRVFRTVNEPLLSPFSFRDLVNIREEILASSVAEPTLLLAELTPTVVYSRKQNLPSLPPSLAITIAQDTRGGFETYHGPGQWTGYLLLPKNCIAPGGKEARAVSNFLLVSLKKALNPLLAHPRIVCRDGAELGLWLDDRKLVSCAFELRRTGTLLGFAVNVYPTPDSFNGVKPCGLDALPAYLFPEADVKTGCSPSQQESFMQKTLQALQDIFNQAVPKVPG